MVTLLIILIIVLVLVSFRLRYKQEQVVGLSREQLLQKHRNAFFVYRFWVILSIVMFIGGYILAEYFPIYETEEYEYWFFGTERGTHEVLTATAWWSYILRGLAIIIFIPAIIGFFDRLSAINKYKNMSADSYSSLQEKTLKDIKKQDEYAKNAKRAKTAMNIFDKIFNQ